MQDHCSEDTASVHGPAPPTELMAPLERNFDLISFCMLS